MQGTPDLDDPVALVPQSEPWGKFVSLNGNKAKSQELSEIETTIGRNPTNTISIPDNRLSGVHCKIKWDNINCVASLVDLSTNGTFIGDSKLGKNNEVLLKNGDEIYLLHKSKVSITDVIGFTLIIQKVKKEEKVEVVVDQAQQKKIQLMEDMQEDIHCPICDDLIYQAVCLMPCLHNFCGACFSDWMAKQKTCPSCRKEVQSVSRNPLVNNVVEKYLNMHPEKKRPVEEYKEMDEKNKIKGDALIFGAAPTPPPPQPTLNVLQNTQPARGGRGRGRGGIVQQQPPPPQASVQKNNGATKQSNISDYSADDDDGPVTRDCLTCKKEINGYQCARKGMHLNCTNCQSKMPKFDPGEKRLVFRCELCEKYFCTLYNKNCQQLSKKNPNCRIEKHQIPGAVDIQCFRNNYIEQKEFLDFMKNKNITTQDIFRYMLDNYISKGGFRYVVNKRTAQQFEKEINMLIQAETPVCSMCFGLIWQQIVFRYRIAIRDQMQADVKNRGYCWFGVNCKTMTHNQEHAKKLDHMCEQTKF